MSLLTFILNESFTCKHESSSSESRTSAWVATLPSVSVKSVDENPVAPDSLDTGADHEPVPISSAENSPYDLLDNDISSGGAGVSPDIPCPASNLDTRSAQGHVENISGDTVENVNLSNLDTRSVQANVGNILLSVSKCWEY